VDRNSNIYTIIYAAILTTVVAVALAFVHSSLEPKMEANEKLANQEDILRSVGLFDLPDASTVYEKSITSLVIDAEGKVLEGMKGEEIVVAAEFKKPEQEQKHPIYIFTDDKGSKRYILPLFGNGLWDKIWGYVALEEDMNTVAGIAMDHKGETPGLGAEIKDNPKQYNIPFVGKTINDPQGNYVSIRMVKGGIKDAAHEIDAISGATITSDGVNEMLERGIGYYMPYFKSLQSQTSANTISHE
jgi:Na+-transporting NADH:ubiquinone oxidoreductase subunit C